MACRVSQQNYEAFLELYKNDYVWDRAQCQSGLSVVQYLDLYVPCLKWLLRGQQFNLNVEKKGKQISRFRYWIYQYFSSTCF